MITYVIFYEKKGLYDYHARLPPVYLGHKSSEWGEIWAPDKDN